MKITDYTVVCNGNAEHVYGSDVLKSAQSGVILEGKPRQFAFGYWWRIVTPFLCRWFSRSIFCLQALGIPKRIFNKHEPFLLSLNDYPWQIHRTELCYNLNPWHQMCLLLQTVKNRQRSPAPCAKDGMASPLSGGQWGIWCFKSSKTPRKGIFQTQLPLFLQNLCCETP